MFAEDQLLHLIGDVNEPENLLTYPPLFPRRCKFTLPLNDFRFTMVTKTSSHFEDCLGGQAPYTESLPLKQTL